MSFGMNEVTSKIAYAYAKQSAFALLGIALVIGGAATGYLVLREGAGKWPILLSASADALVAAAGAAILGLVVSRANLERVNRPALRVTLGALLVLAVGLAVAAALRGPVVELAGQTGLIGLLAIGVVGYPLPIRRGSAVLYAPEAVRQLANARTETLASCLLLAVATPRLLLPGTVPSLGAGALSIGLDAALLDALAVVGALVSVAVRAVGRRVQLLEIVLVLALAIALVLAAEHPLDPVAWALVLPSVAIAGGSLAIVGAWSRRLNVGKTIVSHRA
jgi:hypothetical protein